MLGALSPEARANELENYCMKHLSDSSYLYRIFYYDCLPTNQVIRHIYSKRDINCNESGIYSWMNAFINFLKAKRKFALRLGKLAQIHENVCHTLRPKVLKDLCNGTRQFSDLTEDDFVLSFVQKGVDMKIGIDIASLAYKKQVDRIVLISGDSDFVPAAKLARREGIDFILDPLFNQVSPDLIEHIDGLQTCDRRFRPSK